MGRMREARPAGAPAAAAAAAAAAAVAAVVAAVAVLVEGGDFVFIRPLPPEKSRGLDKGIDITGEELRP